MTKVITKNSFTTGAFPTGLSAGELAVNVVDKILFVGNTFGAGVTLYNVNTLVTSIDGASGAITNVARTNTAQTFAGLQTMITGISAASGYISSSLGVYGTSTSLNSTTTSVTNTSGLLTITPSTAPGAATLRLKADDGDITLYNSDLAAGVGLVGNIVNTLPIITGTLLNQNSTINPTVTANNSSSTVYPLFALGTGNTGLFIDNNAGTKPLKYVPSTGTITTTAYVAYDSGMTLAVDSVAGTLDVNNGTDRLQLGTTLFGHTGASGYTFQSNTAISLVSTGSYIKFAGNGWGYTFPTSSGVVGQVLTTNGTDTLSWQTSVGGGSGFTYTTSAPGSPVVGDRWMDSDTGKEYVYINDGNNSLWMEPVSSSGIVGTTYDSANNLLIFNSKLISPNLKTHSIFTPSDNNPPAANYATIDTRNSIMVLEFDAATDESAVFVGIMPDGVYLGSGLKVRIHWMADTATTGTCRWGAQIERMNTDEDADSFDTAATAGGSANGTSGIITSTEISISTIDSLVGGEPYRLKIYRDADGTSGTDDMAGDAQLVAIEVRSGYNV